MSKREKRTRRRVAFDDWYDTTLVAIDGTWSVNVRLRDVSDGGAKLRVLGKIAERMRNEEFFLMITPDGKVSRRAKIVWENIGQIGIRFLASRHHGS